MYLTYTFYSKALDREESVTLLMTDMHNTQNPDYTAEKLYRHQLRLPALVAMGNTGAEHGWWMRYSFAEADIEGPESIGVVIGVRGMPCDEKSLRFLGEELPDFLCAQFPIDRRRISWCGWKQSAAFNAPLRGSARYCRVLTDTDQTDSASYMQKMIRTALSAHNKGE